MIIKRQILERGWGPGGWQFYQPETNWHAPDPRAWTFAQQVENIRKHRQQNPRHNLSLDPQEIGRELEEYTVARWRSVHSERNMAKFLENPSPDVKKKPHLINSLLSRAVGAAAELAADDPGVLRDWLGDGMRPVPIPQATQRAKVCSGGCPGNVVEGWQSRLSVEAGKSLRQYMRAKYWLNLSTPVDDQLGICSGCKCVLLLKVWTPIDYIDTYLTPETKAKLRSLNPNCWILQECNTPASTIPTDHSSASSPTPSQTRT